MCDNNMPKYNNNKNHNQWIMSAYKWRFGIKASVVKVSSDSFISMFLNILSCTYCELVEKWIYTKVQLKYCTVSFCPFTVRMKMSED